jgi:hypothetical protein
MQGCCTKILRYSQGLTKQHFLEDEMLVDAVLRNLEVLGEAANRSRQRSVSGTPSCPGDALQASAMFWRMPTSAWRKTPSGRLFLRAFQPWLNSWTKWLRQSSDSGRCRDRAVQSQSQLFSSGSRANPTRMFTEPPIRLSWPSPSAVMPLKVNPAHHAFPRIRRATSCVGAGGPGGDWGVTGVALAH